MLKQTLAELVELVGEEQASLLLADLVDGIKSQRRPFDEVAQFLRADAAARGDQEEADKAEFALRWQRAGQRIGAPDPGGRPSRVQFYADLYRRAQDKEQVLQLAERELSRSSLRRLRLELGL